MAAIAPAPTGQYFAPDAAGQAAESSYNAGLHYAPGVSATPLPSSTVPGAPNKTQTVISGAPATADYNSKLTSFNGLKTSVANQSVTNANTTNTNPSVVDYLNSTGKPSSFTDRAALAKTYGITNYTGTAPQNTQLLTTIQGKDQNDAAAAANDPNGTLTQIKDMVSGTGTDTTATDTTAPADPLQTQQDNADTAEQAAMDKLNNESDAALTQFTTEVNQINSGTFPLTAGEQTQVQSLINSFDVLRQQQMIANANYTGGVTQSQALTGNSYYSPQIAMGNIQGAISSGLSKLGDLATKQADAMSKLETSFQTNDYNMVKSSYDALAKTFTDRATAIEKMHTDTTTEIDKLRTYNEKVAQDTFNNSIKSDTMTFKQQQEAFTEYIKQGTLDEKTSNDAQKLMLAQYKAYNTAKGKDIAGTTNPSTGQPLTAADIMDIKASIKSGNTGGGTFAPQGKDSYVDPGAYLDAYSQWTAAGNDVPTFLKEFPVKAYINPTWRDNLPIDLYTPPAGGTPSTTNFF